MKNNPLCVVIIAGGPGSRLWPLSSRKLPKPFLRVGGDLSLLQCTAARARMLVPKGQIFISTLAEYRDLVLRDLPWLSKKNILLEPELRETAPAILWATLLVEQRFPKSSILVLPSDHWIYDPKKFAQTLRSAVAGAEKHHCIFTVGIAPQSPATQYGYLEVGPRLAGAHYSVRRFVEKPNLKKARQLLRSGKYLWNGGIFAFEASVLKQEAKMFLPKTYATLAKVLGKSPMVIRKAFRSVEPISMDYGIMEKSKHVGVVRGDFGWNDLGGFDAIAAISEHDAYGNATDSDLTSQRSRGNQVFVEPGLQVYLAGVDNLVVAMRDGKLLIARKSETAAMKELLKEFRNGPRTRKK